MAPFDYLYSRRCFSMDKILNIGNKKSTLKILKEFKNTEHSPFDVKITNSHITELNKIIGKKIFKKDSLYISSKTLWEIMQPVGGFGRHHYHGLTPENIYESLSTLHKSKNIIPSYDNRYLVITLAMVYTNIPLVIIIEPNGIVANKETTVSKIITIYPYNKK